MKLTKKQLEQLLGWKLKHMTVGHKIYHCPIRKGKDTCGNLCSRYTANLIYKEKKLEDINIIDIYICDSCAKTLLGNVTPKHKVNKLGKEMLFEWDLINHNGLKSKFVVALWQDEVWYTNTRGTYTNKKPNFKHKKKIALYNKAVKILVKRKLNDKENLV